MLRGQEGARQDITEGELQAIAKAMYEERLAELCTEQSGPLPVMPSFTRRPR